MWKPLSSKSTCTRGEVVCHLRSNWEPNGRMTPELCRFAGHLICSLASVHHPMGLSKCVYTMEGTGRSLFSCLKEETECVDWRARTDRISNSWKSNRKIIACQNKQQGNKALLCRVIDCHFGRYLTLDKQSTGFVLAFWFDSQTKFSPRRFSVGERIPKCDWTAGLSAFEHFPGFDHSADVEEKQFNGFALF